ncbi:hypothetical protein PC113_g5234 [Phytophthora cactorum]|uniref:Uncharacterized protein n=1 Tax=Phytophthora cactorum TaxID=29920 RepID=A0A8T0ZMY6_9STRA|nr:hypothetical protein PC112_g15491 [Phytophthora cactorum]KAG2812556.1 hypothetical protein PC111_g14752 [Phytophthora cactorum]KAG2863643.1 hypothetical protein PC113_g5234 [Phytophthora cactorum]
MFTCECHLSHDKVTTAQRENCRFHEEPTVDEAYVKQLLENKYLDTLHVLTENSPVVKIKTSIDTYVAERSDPVPTSMA